MITFAKLYRNIICVYAYMHIQIQVMEQKQIIRCAAISGAFSVALGAFGAHGLQQLETAQKITSEDIRIFETAVRYQFYHTFALLAVAAFSNILKPKLKNWSVIAFITGMIIFSGSLYFLSLSQYLFGERMAWLGAITPLGGLSLIAGWILLFISAFSKEKSSEF